MLQLAKLLLGVLLAGRTRFVPGSRTERLAVGHSLFSSCSRLRKTDRRCLVVCGRTLSHLRRDCHTIMVPILVVQIARLFTKTVRREPRNAHQEARMDRCHLEQESNPNTMLDGSKHCKSGKT